MRTITWEQLTDEYLIYKTLTPNKFYKTYLAVKECSNGIPVSVILKEMDEKRASIYFQLLNMWNPYIATTYKVFQLSAPNISDSKRYIAVTEYVCTDDNTEEECLSLTQFVHKYGSLPESTSLSICTQLCEGLNEFHKKGFVHRDLKPDNIMVAKCDIKHPHIKIIDFGSAKYHNPSANVDTTVIGTLGYQAPESLSSHVSKRADIYSIGCILNFMLTGKELGNFTYKGNHYIVNIIEKATNVDPFFRYHDTTAMKKELLHELRTTLWDKIPVLRSLPGFRTHTLWKELLAIPVHTFWVLFTLCGLVEFGVRVYFELLIFYVIIPLITLCNMGNLLRFFPRTFRQNNQLFFIVRLVLFLISFIVPILFDNIVGGINT